MKELVYYSQLYSIYSALLSKKQQQYLNAYFNEDQSFREIARQFKISAAAAADAIKKGKAKLLDLEKKLKLLEKNHILAKIYDSIDDENLKKEIAKLNSFQ